jgi:hypothetical protein
LALVADPVRGVDDEKFAIAMKGMEVDCFTVAKCGDSRAENDLIEKSGTSIAAALPYHCPL